MPPVNGKQYWRSLDDLADTPEFRAFVEREFSHGISELLDPPSRRRFLQLMGASLGLAGMAACRWPEENILPYAHRPEGRTPGEPVQYATAFELGGVATGLLVTSYDGRPIKIEGNPKHPYSLGATSAIMQASILDLYDPDRSQTVVRREGPQAIPSTWDDFVTFARSHFGDLRRRGGEGLCVLSEVSSSPSLADMQTRFRAAFPKARWHVHEPINRDNEILGSILAFGKPCRTHYHLDRARVIVCLDADPLMTHPAALRYARDFVAGRCGNAEPADHSPTSSGHRRGAAAHGKTRASFTEMSRLYAVESTFSVTGAAADHRYAVRSGDVAVIAVRLLLELVKAGVAIPAVDGKLRESLEQVARADVPTPFVEVLARELSAHKGHGLIAVGPRQPAWVNAIGCLLNAALGHVGRTVSFTFEPTDADPQAPAHIRHLTAAARQGSVDTLVILGGNPVYSAGADVDFGEVLGRVKTSIHLSLYDDETSRRCMWHLPRAHYLESWGDARAYDGTVSIIQPLIEPLYGGRTPIELLALLTDDPVSKGYDIVRRTFGREFAAGGDADVTWRQALREGIVANTRWSDVQPTVVSTASAASGPLSLRGQVEAGALVARPEDRESFELVACQDHSVYDGRFANNAWLQEMPDPLTKLTWDNAAILSPHDARRLGVRSGDVIRVEADSTAGSDGRKAAEAIEVAAYVLPGQAAGSITLPLGYGRQAGGRVAPGIGVNACSPIRRGAPTPAASVRISATGRRHRLAITEDHHAADLVGLKERQRRIGGPGEIGELVREATLEHYREHPDFAQHAVHVPELKQLWKEPISYDGHRWAMAIDLHRCIGCGACVVACQAENNIPVVGREQVIRGREMHWIRIDRYFKGPPENPAVVFQPVACVHCENAPCEQVCPVAATVHDHEGLNVMVYNRCVGTRYCSNNCPYKVRRFNFFNYRRHVPDTEKMAMNPEVTVRSRGVMEKCTYCVQRIQVAKIKAKNERRPLRDGEIVPACAQVCPTQAIVFGDLSDPDSRVAKLHRDGRAYGMLAELNVRPRTMHLAKVRNVREGDGGKRM